MTVGEPERVMRHGRLVAGEPMDARCCAGVEPCADAARDARTTTTRGAPMPDVTTTADRPSADYDLWLLDFDGTVRHGRDELGRFVNGPEDVVVFPEVPGMLYAHGLRGGRAHGVTNQGGVALGYMTEDANADAIRATLAACEIQGVGGMQGVLCCEHAPDAGCWCRKPLPGMLVRIAGAVGRALGEEVPRHRCLMVGDRPEDAEAARRAGVPFRVASEWRAGQ